MKIYRKTLHNQSDGIQMPRILYCGPCLDREWRGAHHCHQEVCEVLYVLRGEGETIIDKSCFQASAGDIIIHNAGVWHHERKRSEDFRAMVISYKSSEQTPHDLLPEDRLPVIRREDMPAQLVSVLEALGGETAIDDIHRALTDAYAQAIFCLLSRFLQGNTRTEASPSLCREVICYLETHYMQSVTLNDLADALGFSPYYISHLIKELHGQSLMSLLVDIRMQEARKLLKETRLSLDKIAFRIGYADASSFTRAFRRHDGMLPGQYRNNG